MGYCSNHVHSPMASRQTTRYTRWKFLKAASLIVVKAVLVQINNTAHSTLSKAKPEMKIFMLLCCFLRLFTQQSIRQSCHVGTERSGRVSVKGSNLYTYQYSDTRTLFNYSRYTRPFHTYTFIMNHLLNICSVYVF